MPESQSSPTQRQLEPFWNRKEDCLRLCLHCQSPVQRCGIEDVLHAVVENVDNIHTRIRGRARFIIAANAARAVAETCRGAASCSSASVRDIWRRSRNSGNGIEVGRSRSLRGNIDGKRRRLIVMGRHDDSSCCLVHRSFETKTMEDNKMKNLQSQGRIEVKLQRDGGVWEDTTEGSRGRTNARQSDNRT